MQIGHSLAISRIRGGAVADSTTPVISGSSLISGDLTFTTTVPGDLYYSYEASSTPLTGAALKAAALAPATDQTVYIGVADVATGAGTLLNYPTANDTYYLQYCIQAANGNYSNIVVEAFTVAALSLTMVQSAGVGPGCATAQTGQSITLPTGITNGNTLVLVIANGNTATFATPPTGWSLLGFGALPFSQNTAGKVYIWTKTASGDSGATVSWTASGVALSAGVFYELQLPAGTIEWAGYNATASSDPPAITPSTGGSIPRIIIPVAFVERSTGSYSAAPAGYSGLISGFTANPGVAATGERKVGSAWANLTNTVYDPGVFTFTAHNERGAITIAAW